MNKKKANRLLLSIANVLLYIYNCYMYACCFVETPHPIPSHLIPDFIISNGWLLAVWFLITISLNMTLIFYLYRDKIQNSATLRKLEILTYF